MISRILTEEVLPWLGTAKILNIKGARRVGKTTFLRYLEQILKDRGETTAYMSVEQKHHLPMFATPGAFVQYLRAHYGLSEEKKLYLFLDDFQYIKDPIHFLQGVNELTEAQCQLILAASTSFKATPTGDRFSDEKRKKFFLRHLSFGEYLTAHTNQFFNERFSINDAKALTEFYHESQGKIEEYINEFIHWGGYPEIAFETRAERKFEILGEIIHRYIEKDISSFLRIENVQAYIELMATLSNEVGNLLNNQDLSTRLNIHKKTLGKYLEIISDTFTFSYVPPYFTNTKKELAKMCRVYAQDAGIQAYFLHQNAPGAFSAALTPVQVKNFVYTELRKMGYNHNLFFYRTIAKAEIDFVICGDKEIIPIKIKFGKHKQTGPVAIKNFQRLYGDMVNRGVIITRDELRFEDGWAFIPYILLPFVKL